MGVLTALRVKKAADAMRPNGQGLAGSNNISSPWSAGQLSTIVWSDVFGTAGVIMNREEAMTIPAVAKARQVLIATIAGRPLRAYKGAVLEKNQPEWLERTDGQVSPWHRMAWTIDDCLFYGWSLWLTARKDRNDDGSLGDIIDAQRCPFGRWSVNEDSQIVVDDVIAEEGEVLLIPGPFEGLLQVATRTLRGAARLETAWVARAQNPIPALDLHRTDDSLEDDEVEDLIADWIGARNDVNGIVGSTPPSVDARVLGQLEPKLFIEGRNFVKIDVGNFTGIPGSLLDGSLSTASLTYSTQEGTRNDFGDYTLPFWINPIEGRFSQDDIIGTGLRIRFDFADLFTPTQSPTGPVTKD